MRSIRERLEAMEPEPAPAEQERTSPVGVPIEAVAPGIERINQRGRHYLVDTPVPDPTDGALPERNPVLPKMLCEFMTNPSDVAAQDILFLDTETTGLDRGTGTHVFLVGVGYFDGLGFRVQQFFIRDLYEEASLLHDLGELVREFPVLTTFNGRAFDWPLLYNRFILHGYRDIPELIHWDLLASARRLWRNRLRDCSLGNLERQILNVERYGDVPGYLIPQIYFDYLRTRDARPLQAVFSHNHEDIVSLARLAEVVLGAECEPLTALSHPVDQVSYGLHLMEREGADDAEHLILCGLDDPELEPNLRGRAYVALGTRYKREGRWSDALDLWQRMEGHSWRSPDLALYPIVERAKYYEHRARDYTAALTQVERALNLASLRDWNHARGELAHRLARLQRKQFRSG